MNQVVNHVSAIKAQEQMYTLRVSLARIAQAALRSNTEPGSQACIRAAMDTLGLHSFSPYEEIWSAAHKRDSGWNSLACQLAEAFHSNGERQS